MESVANSDVKPCKCGKPPRPGQRNCHDCHNSSMKRYRLKTRLGVERLMLAFDKLTTSNDATKAAFNTKCQSPWVIIQGANGAPDISGIVVGFLPERVLRVMDDHGEIRITSVDQIEEDVHRRIYGKTNKRSET